MQTGDIVAVMKGFDAGRTATVVALYGEIWKIEMARGQARYYPPDALLVVRRKPDGARKK